MDQTLPQPIQRCQRLRDEIAFLLAQGLVLGALAGVMLNGQQISMCQVLGLSVEQILIQIAGSGSCCVDEGMVLVLHKAFHAQLPGNGLLGLQVPMHVARFAYMLCLKIWSMATSYGFSIYGVDVPYNAVKGKSAKRSHDLLVMLRSGDGSNGHGLSTIEIFVTRGLVGGAAVAGKFAKTKKNFTYAGSLVLQQFLLVAHYKHATHDALPVLRTIKWHRLVDGSWEDAFTDANARPSVLQAAESRPQVNPSPPPVTLSKQLEAVNDGKGPKTWYRLQDAARDLGSRLPTYRVASFLQSKGVKGIKKILPKDKWGGSRAKGRGSKKGSIWGISKRGLSASLKKGFPELLKRKRS